MNHPRTYRHNPTFLLELPATSVCMGVWVAVRTCSRL